MQRMIKFELKRSFKNRLFLISLLISLALVTWYSIERIPYCVQLNSEFLNDENLMGFFEISYTNWIGSHNIYLQQNIFYMAIPILATLPFGSSFYDDINRGYARNVWRVSVNCTMLPKRKQKKWWQISIKGVWQIIDFIRIRSGGWQRIIHCHWTVPSLDMICVRRS